MNTIKTYYRPELGEVIYDFGDSGIPRKGWKKFLFGKFRKPNYYTESWRCPIFIKPDIPSPFIDPDGFNKIMDKLMEIKELQEDTKGE